MSEELRNIEDLKHSFSVRPTLGEKLPNVKDVSDKASFYLKDADTYVKHKMINGKWYKEVTRASDSAIIFQEV